MLKPFYKIPDNYERLRHLRGSVIVIEANIGAGKTTLGTKLVELLQNSGIPAKFYEEPINLTLLELFLTNPEKYAFTLQMFMLTQRKGIYIDAEQFARKENGVAIIDRGILGDIAFFNLNLDLNRINDSESKVYMDVVQNMKLPQPTNVVYLDVHPEIALQRIKGRNRGSEGSIYTIEYLQELDSNHKLAFEESDIPITYFDWNKPRMLCNDELLDVCDNLDPHK